MVRFYDPIDRADLERVVKQLAAAGIEYAVTPPAQGSKLPGAIGIAEEDLPRAEELLGSSRTHTRH